MKLKSLIQNCNKLEVAEVEIEFIPGIPQIHFLGLPDRIIKESFYRIKSALKSCDYKFPLTNQMIVNIKPNHLRKSSRGVELAVALGILLKTGQIENQFFNPDWVIYGELGLDGDIFEPSDLALSIPYLQNINILTGKGEGTTCFRMESLKNIEVNYTKNLVSYQRPQPGLQKLYSQSESDFLFLAAASGVHALLAGTCGAGKSTLAYALNSFLKEPNESENVRLEKRWRPLISPHQSISPSAFLGGGSTLYEGEIERAHGGILLLDEMLEFDSEILEALRGPMTGDKLRLSRAANQREIECSFQVVATTNLCPCGKWSPIMKNIGCRFSRGKCTRYIESFSGPLLDRFGILHFADAKQLRTVSGVEILKRIVRYFDFCDSKPEIQPPSQAFESYHSGASQRRINYLRQISMLLACDRIAAAQSKGEFSNLKVEVKDINRAEQWVIKPFEQLEKGMS